MCKISCKTLILDFDGTLGDTCKLIVKTLQDTMERVGLPVADETSCVATIGLPLFKCFQELIGCDEAFAYHCADIYSEELFPRNNSVFEVRPFPHVTETLKILHTRGVVLTIASSRRSSSIVNMLVQMKLIEYFSQIVGALDVKKAKPAPDMVLKILEKTKTKPTQSLVVGDASYDVLMGRNAGCLTCGVTYGNGSPESLIDSGADYMINDFGDLLKIL